MRKPYSWAELAVELGMTPEKTEAGTFMDPRSIGLSAEPHGRSLTVIADHVTTE
jgi:hypothetical protein